jgi:TolB-like protein/tetratricopeptide (TPR) repeat protein
MTQTQDLALPLQMGRYTLLRQLGRGGMGVVYAARDERLDRDVAVKMMAGLSDEASIKRFWREARAAASVSHPNVCQIYEVDEGHAGLFLAMELLEGETLEARLERGPCSPAEALRVSRDLLGAVAALHERELVHRDVKPANVFLTRHGAKLLDFGLARAGGVETVEIGDLTPTAITRPGIVMGTPAYMSPEQIRGEELDPRSDVYSVGVVLFEMLSGKIPFNGRGILEIAAAILREHPPALQGSPTIIAIDRVIRRALARDAAQRYPAATDMAADLSAIHATDSSGERAVPVRTLVRLIVPPMRLLRDEPSLSFLPFGLAEAVSGSLAALPDVVVRAPALGAHKEGEIDPRELATKADVDLVVLGSLLTSGAQIRANVQLIEASTGTVLGARAIKGDSSDIFALEDQLSQSVIEMLKPHRSTPEVTAQMRSVPAKGKAFEYFLRGIEHARDLAESKAARDWFEKAVEDDPLFAPAWAWLGRCYRVIGKYEEDRDANNRRAEEAFRRALALDADLPVAHRYLSHLETEGGRSDAAIARLLQHATVNRNDAQLFAALVHACRYAGLTAASLAAHEEARRLDPTVRTSFEYTLVAAGMFDRLDPLVGQPGIDPGGLLSSIVFDDGNAAGLEALKIIGASRIPPGVRIIYDAISDAVHYGKPDSARRAVRELTAEGSYSGPRGDPEAMFLCASLSARIGDDEVALTLIEETVRNGYGAIYLLETSPTFDGVRSSPRFTAALELARRRREVAAAIFERNGGGTLLGLAPGTA